MKLPLPPSIEGRGTVPSGVSSEASGYLTQRELYKLGALITLAFLAVYLLIGSPWVYFVMR